MKKALLYIIIFVFFSGTLFGVFTLTENKNKQTPLSSGVNTILAPVQTVITAVENKTEGFFEGRKSAQNYREENEKLKEEIGKLEYEIRNAEGLKKENSRLRQLLEMKESNKSFDMVFCQVIARDIQNENAYIKVNKGTSSGISVEDTAVLNYALAGKVCETGKNWAKISLTISGDFAIGAVVSRTQETAVVEGNSLLSSQNKLKMTFLSDKTQIKKQDKVETSGMGGVFPKSLLIGTVCEIKENGEVIIDTGIDFNNIQEIGIIKRGQQEKE